MSKNGKRYYTGDGPRGDMDDRFLYVADERMKSYNPERHKKERRKFKYIWDDRGVEHILDIEEENN